MNTSIKYSAFVMVLTMITHGELVSAAVASRSKISVGDHNRADFINCTKQELLHYAQTGNFVDARRVLNDLRSQLPAVQLARLIEFWNTKCQQSNHLFTRKPQVSSRRFTWD